LKKLGLLLLLVVAAVIGWGILRKNTPPSVTFARVKRETLVSTLPTNGKVEPLDWEAVRAQSSGLVSRVDVVEGGPVAKGGILAVMSDPSLQPDIDAATAKIAEAQANLASLEAGMRPAEVTEIENGLARTNLELQEAERELGQLQRLAEKNAATAMEVTAARDKVDQLKVQIAGLEKRRHNGTPSPDLAAARARLQDAQVALKAAQDRAALSEIRAPIAGAIYGLAVRVGTFLNRGDLVANIGLLDRLRVRVYIDEPELGRVALGQPVTITWQALPGRQWNGTVEKKPVAIEPLGSRQVGQVLCNIENPEHVLIPGTNVDATIRTAVSNGALTIPKETMRHDSNGDYVFLLKGDTLEQHPVRAGNSSVTRIQIVEGLSEGDRVAMPSDDPLRAGMRVTAVNDTHS
jgi:HlyD family secretion protein